jgi:hypothetical protein
VFPYITSPEIGRVHGQWDDQLFEPCNRETLMDEVADSRARVDAIGTAAFPDELPVRTEQRSRSERKPQALKLVRSNTGSYEGAVPGADRTSDDKVDGYAKLVHCLKKTDLNRAFGTTTAENQGSLPR